MKREDLEDYTKTFIKQGNKFEKLEIVHEDPDTILFILTEKSETYIYSRRVFLIALRSREEANNGWIMIAPSLRHFGNLTLIKETFEKVWKSNPENG